MPVTEDEIITKMDKQLTRALEAMVKYKFWMFGYHAAGWVNLNKLLDKGHRNPFRYLLQAAIFIQSPAAAEWDLNVWGENSQYTREGWRYEVSRNDTSLGYWEWVAHQTTVGEW